MDAFKIALVVFLALAVLTVVVVFVRGVLSKGFPTPQSSSQFDQINYGAMPPTPKPSWANEREEDT